MKTSYFKYALLFSIVIPSAVFSQEKATLKETTDFLKPKLTGRFHFISGNTYYDCSMDFDYKTCVMKYKIDGVAVGEPNTITYTMSLKNINFKNISYDPKYFLLPLMVNNDEAFISKDETYGTKREVSKEKRVVLYYLYGNDTTNVKRIKSALVHAIKLCGGKGETF